MKFRLLILLAFAVAFLARATAGAPSASLIYMEPDSPASIEVTPVTDRWNGAGFLPARVRIENRAEKKLGWTLLFTAQMGYSGTTVSQELFLEVEGRTAAETVVFIAGAGEVPRGQRATLIVKASGPGARHSQAYLLGGGGSDPVVNTATAAALESDLFAATNGASGVKTEITPIDAARWPADWRVWSPFDYVVLSASEYAALDGARRAALHDWVALGGALDVFPAGGHGSQSRRTERIGHGEIRHRADALSTLRDYSYQPSSRPVRAESPGISGERREELRPGTGALGLSLFLIVFGVLVGPVNLFVFAPSNRRHRLFVTVPLISLAASVLMAGYIVVKDGFGGEGSRHGVVFLLPDSNQAVVRQQQLARTGVLVGSGFELPDSVVLSRIGAAQPDSHHFARRRHGEENQFYDRGHGRAAGDWFSSRRLQEHSLTRIVPTRARVELLSAATDGAGPTVQSSVGCVLRDFVYRDENDRLWTTAELPPGKRVTLAPLPAIGPEGGARPARGDFRAKGGAAEGLAPIATLTSIRWDEPDFLYTGPLAGARQP